MSLLWRVFTVNAAVLVLAAVVLVVSPATVSFPVALAEALVLCVGLVALLVVNLVLLRRVLKPLERLTEVMRDVDPLRPGSRLVMVETIPEVTDLTVAFNEMLERLESERRESARRALAAAEAERRRISRELHDQVGQMLTGVVLELDGAVRSGDLGHVAETREAVRASLEEIRGIARRLRPESLDDLGLVSALRGLLADVSRGAGFDTERELESLPPGLSDDEELVVYRVAQEALTNAARHAHARHVRLRFGRRDGVMELIVHDDGRGFDPARRTDGAGIRGMRERAVLIGADLTVVSVPGQGTEVRLRLTG